MIMRNINISSCTAARKTSVIFLNKKIPAQFVFQKKRAKRRILNIHTIGRSIGLKSSQIFAIYLQDFPILKRDRNPRRFYHLIEKIGLSLFIPPSLPPTPMEKERDEKSNSSNENSVFEIQIASSSRLCRLEQVRV